MSNFHIRPDGTVTKCSATVGVCPFGGQNEHYESPELAFQSKKLQEKEAEKIIEEAFSKCKKDAIIRRKIAEKNKMLPTKKKKKYEGITKEQRKAMRQNQKITGNKSSSIDEIAAEEQRKQAMLYQSGGIISAVVGVLIGVKLIEAVGKLISEAEESTK